MENNGEDLERIEREGVPNRKPTHPGEILQKEFLEPEKIQQKDLAAHINRDPKTINRLVNGHTSVTPSLARQLAAALGTTPDFWLNPQKSVDLWEARQEGDDLPEPIISAPDQPAASV